MVEEINGFLFYDTESAFQNDDFELRCFPEFQKYIPNNFWYKSRNIILSNALEKVFKGKDQSLMTFWEIGCGNGFVIKHFKKTFPNIQFSASDIYAEALNYTKLNNPDKLNIFQYNLLKDNLNQKFDAIGCFDVLEHIEEDSAAMANLFGLLKDQGHAVITVPSDMYLWSNTDVVGKHKRRYSKKELSTKLRNAGFEIVYINHFVFFLYPVLLLKAKFQKKIENKFSSDETDIVADLNLNINPFLNSFFYLIMLFEIFIMKTGLKFPFGSSLICIVKKVK